MNNGPINCHGSPLEKLMNHVIDFQSLFYSVGLINTGNEFKSVHPMLCLYFNFR